PIYTLPIGVKGAEFIADSDEFHNRIVVISKEADTFEGEFARFAVDGKTIGWTACSGLQVYPSCTLDDALSRKERWKRKGKRKWLLTNNKRKRRISNKKAEQQTTEEVGEERDIQAPKSSDINFVNMGRLSPEKGQDMLIRAFADVHRVHENSCLYILGKGPLENDLASLAAELGLDGCVHLAGQLDNPFGLMKKCDAFVLSSHYEGQPMVLLEALTLGMNIVATDIVANRTVLENGKYGMLVEKSVEGLKEGMFSVINHKGMPAYQPFDSRRYNEQAMQTFYDCLKR
ncbi:MAG TPA: glycosyltransferase, partial [Bacillales bacterium]|nr:glycosyltransferase [Bacillales bacterium]